MSLSLFVHLIQPSTILTIASLAVFQHVRRPRNSWLRLKWSKPERRPLERDAFRLRWQDHFSLAPRAGRGELYVCLIAIFLIMPHAFTGRLAWLVCGTPRFSDMWECVHSQRSAFPENTRVAR